MKNKFYELKEAVQFMNDNGLRQGAGTFEYFDVVNYSGNNRYGHLYAGFEIVGGRFKRVFFATVNEVL